MMGPSPLKRTVVHLDADAFFASVEQASDTRLRGKPVAVGGEKRGIIAAASYEARKFGVYTPMPTAQARKLCPKLILLPGDYEKYERFSRWMFSYAYDFTPDVEITSIDEGYFDLSGVRRSASEIAQTIRKAIGQTLKITVSEGIGSNKLVSQIASKLYKPAAFQEIEKGYEIPFLHPLANHWLPGIGPKSASRLNAAGLARIGQISATETDLLHLILGNMAPRIREYADGYDERPIVPRVASAKSYGKQETFTEDQTDEDQIEATLRRMADVLMAKVRVDGKCIRTLTVKVRYNDMMEDQCGESLGEPTDLETDIYGRLGILLRKAWRRRVSLRLVSLKLSNVYDSFYRSELTLDGASEQRESRRRLARIVDDLKRRCGAGTILRGHDFILRDAATEKVKTKTKGKGFNIPFPSVNNKRKYPSAEKTTGDMVCRSPQTEYEGNKGRRNVVNAKLSSTVHRKVVPVSLNVKSYYSFLNSTLSVEDIVRLAREQGQSAVAMMDQGNLHGAVPFYQCAQEQGIQPLIGAEVGVDGKPLLLYVENDVGYRNLCHLLSTRSPVQKTAIASANKGRARGRNHRAITRGIQPVVRRICGHANWTCDQLAALPMEGLIAVGQDVRLHTLFEGRFYLSVSHPDSIRNLPADDPRWPLVAILPVHYESSMDDWKFDVVQSIRTLTLLKQRHPDKAQGSRFHFPTTVTWRELWKEYPLLLERTCEIAARCQGFQMPVGPPQFPDYRPVDGSSPRTFLRKLVMRGLRERYPESRRASMQRQAEEELTIISDVGYEEYFLVVWDLLQDCRAEGIHWITRGSAADSLVCYCLRISDVCPIRFDLYFRRFLNKDRMALHKLPDIDMDFPHDRKDDVIDLIFRKYGEKYCAVVGGFSTYKSRGAMGDVAKVLGVSEYQIRRLTERFPYAGARDMSTFASKNQECQDLPLQEEPYRTALKMAEFLDGFPRYPKMHPCGVVLSRQAMQDLTPTFTAHKGYPTTHFDMDAVEAVGLVKMDILAQGGLSVMRDVKAMLHERGMRMDLDRCKWRVMQTGEESLPEMIAAPEQDPWTDPKVWAMIAGGGARAVHHIESPAMVSLCRMCNVREIDGLVAIVSVIRPGAANEQKKLHFTRRYQKLEDPVYPHPSLARCLKSTFGLVVYEEHILQICELFAGLAPGRADVLRRALNKRKKKTIETIRCEFVQSAIKRGHSEEKIQEVWVLVSGFNGYAFCKAHSTAYGVEAYQSAWIKYYFPAEFMASVLTQGKGFYHPLVYVLECDRLGIPLFPPSVNAPGPGYGVERLGGDAHVGLCGERHRHAKHGIRVPLSAVKGLTEQTVERAQRERIRGLFTSMSDFHRRVFPLADEMERLMRVGAFDGFGKPRTSQFWMSQFLCRSFSDRQCPDQGWLLPPPDTDRLPKTSLKEPTWQQRLEWENEALGFPASGHPLELHPGIAWDTYCPVERLGAYVGKEVTTCGLVIEQRLHHQITGEPMKFLTLADKTGIVETELFASTYRSYGLATVRYPVLEVTARVEPYENGRGFSLRVLRASKPRKR
ncbi:MAG: DNA polymerase III subunit alpha [Limisphaerales bacterium]|nr:fused DNA polymerase IV/DNA polymerase III subunit alpha [Pedosphaera sp.]HAW01791.1 fused DNA polymerase IV/DNA polymerase III subunit alpha [Verrucomicrobiales bacterium]HCP36991.1 fused DNA polymerase IV/DNA polymerase III subunit alpha [Verrucomicrobiales bacterium]